MAILKDVQKEIEMVLDRVDRTQMQLLCDKICNADRIFISGEGRSGFSARGFAMRLMHLGFEVFFIGETITPSMKKEDLFIGISGSGTSKYVLIDMSKALDMGVETFSVSSKKESNLVQKTSYALIIPGTVKGSQNQEIKSIQLLSSLFDQCLHITLDVVCLMLSKQINVDNSETLKRHF